MNINETIAELSSVEFYNQRKALLSGDYKVIEHDGEINIARIEYEALIWYSELEYSQLTIPNKFQESEEMFDREMQNYNDDINNGLALFNY